jgi:hypothetical protein
VVAAEAPIEDGEEFEEVTVEEVAVAGVTAAVGVIPVARPIPEAVVTVIPGVAMIKTLTPRQVLLIKRRTRLPRQTRRVPRRPVGLWNPETF